MADPIDPASQSVIDAAAVLVAAVKAANLPPGPDRPGIKGGVDVYDPAHPPEAKDVIYGLRASLVALQVAAMGVSMFASGTPAAAAVAVIAAQLPAIEKLIEDAIVKIELFAAGVKP